MQTIINVPKRKEMGERGNVPQRGEEKEEGKERRRKGG